MEKGYKALRVYQLAHRLAVEVHRMTLADLPKFERYEEGSQIRRSSKAIPSNIVEGYGRRVYRNDYLRFLTYAVASCDETKEHLQLLVDTASLDAKRGESLLQCYEQLGRDLYNFVKGVLVEHQPGWPKDPDESSMVRESRAQYFAELQEVAMDWNTWLGDHAPAQ